MCKIPKKLYWKNEGLNNKCKGLDPTGVQIEEDCALLCGHDTECDVYQFHPIRAECFVGQSRDCDGESGWTGGRKKPTAREEMKQACDNFERATQLQKLGQTQLEKEVQDAVDMSQSTCFQSMCSFMRIDLECSEEERKKWARQLQSCDDGSEWTVGDWSVCRSNGVALCGLEGEQKRKVTCSNEDVERCKVTPEPASTQSCTILQGCDWLVSEWGPCDANSCDKIGSRSRSVTCNSVDGASHPCEAKGISKPRVEDSCWKEGCNPENSCAAGRRLNWNQSSLWEARKHMVSEKPHVSRARALSEENEESRGNTDATKALSAMECAELSAKAGLCAVIAGTLVPIDEGGAAGLSFQTSMCQSQQLDEILVEVKQINVKIDALTDIVVSGFEEVTNRIEEQTEDLTGAMAELAREQVAELKVHQRASAQKVVAEVEERSALTRKYLACRSSSDRRAALGNVNQMTEQISNGLASLQQSMDSNLADMSERLNDMEGRLGESLAATASSVVNKVEDSWKLHQKQQEDFFFATLENATGAIAHRLQQQSEDVEEAVRGIVKSEIAVAFDRALESMEESQQSQSDEILASLGGARRAILSKVADVSDSLADLMKTQAKDDLQSMQIMLQKLSRTTSRELLQQADEAESRAAVRSERLEGLLTATIETASSENKALLRTLRREVVKGREIAVSAVETAVGDLKREIQQVIAAPMDAISKGVESIAGEMRDGFGAVAVSMGSVSSSVLENQQMLNSLVQRSDKAIERVEAVQRAVADIHSEVVRLNQEILEGQEEIANSISLLNRNLDGVSQLVEDVLRQQKDLHVREMVARFKASSILIDGAFLDLNQTWLPNATAQTRWLHHSFSDYVKCEAGAATFARSFAQDYAAKIGVLSQVQGQWRALRDQFMLLSSILVDSRLLSAQFESVALMVTQEDLLLVKQLLPVQSGTGTCSALFGHEGAKAIRSILLKKIRQQPLSLARRVSAIWKQVLNIATEQESMGRAVSTADLEYVRNAYTSVLKDLMHLRAKVLDSSGVMKQFHIQVLDLHLPQLCPPPPRCVSQIFTQFQEAGTSQLVLWRQVQDALVLVRRPSRLLQLQGVFAWTVDLVDESSLPIQLAGDFAQSVYICYPQNERSIVSRAKDAPNTFADAFRFCGIPAASGSLGDSGSARCSAQGAVPVDSWTPGSGVTENIFFQWESEARDQGLFTAVCGNSEVEFGEICDEGANSSGGCVECRVVSPGWDCSSGRCRPQCGDGLVFPGVEECDDGGLLLGCTSSCKLSECQRLGPVAKPQNEDIEDLEMHILWTQAHGMRNPPSSDLLAMQGYKVCFNFTEGHGQAVSKDDFGECDGSGRLAFVIQSDSNGIVARYDLDFGDVVFKAQPHTTLHSGPHQVRLRQHDNSDLELVLSCRVGPEVWDRCTLWSVREGEVATTASTYHATNDTLSFLSFSFNSLRLRVL